MRRRVRMWWCGGWVNRGNGERHAMLVFSAWASVVLGHSFVDLLNDAVDEAASTFRNHLLIWRPSFSVDHLAKELGLTCFAALDVLHTQRAEARDGERPFLL